jgi:hypothetical protein
MKKNIVRLPVIVDDNELDAPVTAEELAELETLRPRTRADCIDGPRPCPWAGCRHHLGITVDEDSYENTIHTTAQGRLAADAGDEEVGDYTSAVADDILEMKETCALDVAQDSATLDEIGRIWGVTRERARQLEVRALKKLRHRIKHGHEDVAGVAEFEDHAPADRLGALEELALE